MRRGFRRGLTLAEVVVAGGLTTLILMLVAGLVVGGSRLLVNGTADASTQAHAQKAIQIISRDLRAARGLISINNDENDVTLQLPTNDGSGNLVFPMSDGHTVRYYLNNGQLTRVESGPTPTTQVLVKSLGSGGTFLMTPMFVDENHDGVHQASEMRAATIRLTVNEQTATRAAPTRSYDSRAVVYLQNRSVPTPTAVAAAPDPSVMAPGPDNPGASEEW